MINQQIGEEVAEESTNTFWKSKGKLVKKREMNFINSMNFCKRDYAWEGEGLVRDELLLLKNFSPTSLRENEDYLVMQWETNKTDPPKGQKMDKIFNGFSQLWFSMSILTYKWLAKPTTQCCERCSLNKSEGPS